MRLNGARFGALKVRSSNLLVDCSAAPSCQLIWSGSLRGAWLGPALLAQHEAVLRVVCHCLLSMDVFRLTETTSKAVRCRGSIAWSWTPSSILPRLYRSWIICRLRMRMHSCSYLWALSLTCGACNLVCVGRCLRVCRRSPIMWHVLAWLGCVWSTAWTPILAYLHLFR